MNASFSLYTLCLLVATAGWHSRAPTVATAFVLPTQLLPWRQQQHHPSTKLAAHTPSWVDLEKMLGPAYTAPNPISIDSVLDTETPTFSTEHPTLFRERHGWCPYSERVWLALEMINGGMDYDTVRIDNTGGPRPSYYGGQTPQMKWPKEGRNQGESYDLVQALDAKYNNHQLQSDSSQVNDCVNQFRSIFPRARPSSRAAFLFQMNGQPLSKSTFEETLTLTNDLIGKISGPFLVGDQVTAADIAWAPFLERYRYQLPCLHQGLEPDNGNVYPNLAAWYNAMEEQVPAYACRVKGDASSWRKVLLMAGFGNSGAPPAVGNNMDELAQREASTAAACVKQDVWDRYAASRPHVASTPSAEAARIMTQNRHRIVPDIQKQRPKALPDSEEKLDALLRDLVSVLQCSGPENWDTTVLDSNSPEMVGQLASFLDGRMCVPRDMGAMSAACIKDLAWKLSPQKVSTK